MGRNISARASSNTKVNVTGSIFTRAEPAGFLGVFQTGRYLVYSSNGTFVVPSSVTKIRVRAVGGGGGARGGSFGGAGGGYAHGIFNVNPGESYAVTVGLQGLGPTTVTNGGTSSFGILISATGGQGTTSTTDAPTPGSGIGGDFQASGGTSILNGGGGASGSQLGNGGNGSIAFGGGGAVNGNSPLGFGGASAFGTMVDYDGAPDISGGISIYGNTVATNGNPNPINATIRFPFEGFVGGGGAANTNYTLRGISRGGSGAGGGAAVMAASQTLLFGGDGGFGGGGGAIPVVASANTLCRSGNGGIGAGAGSGGLTGYGGGNGGPGIVIVEW